jgi:uncharacterized protein (TIRG00374 family)
VKRSTLFKLVRLVIGIGLIVFLITRQDLNEIAGHFRRVEMLPIALAAVMFFAMVAINSIRWRVLLDAKGIRVNQLRLLYYYLVGNFFSAALPTSVGGDFVRVVGVGGETGRRAEVFGSVVVDRLLGFAVLLPLGLLAMPFVGSGLTSWGAVVKVWVVATLAFAGAFMMLLRPVARRASIILGPLLNLLERFRARERLERAYGAVVSYSCCRGAVYLGVALSVVSKIFWIYGCLLIAHAFGLDIGFMPLLFIVPIVELARMIPISISGLGVREAAFVFMLGQFGVDEGLGLAYAVVVYAVFTALALVGGLLYGAAQLARRS